MLLLLIRHGATDVISSHLCGHTPGIALNRLGREQAALTATRLARPAAIYASPIQRARETAEIVARANQMIPQTIPDFAEFKFGEWTGKPFAELQRDPRWHEFNAHRELVSAPGGESMREVQARSVAAANLLAEKYGDTERVVVVTHGDVIRGLLMHVAQMALGNYWRLQVDAASISEIAYDTAAGSTIVRMNDRAHLESLHG